MPMVVAGSDVYVYSIESPSASRVSVDYFAQTDERWCHQCRGLLTKYCKLITARIAYMYLPFLSSFLSLSPTLTFSCSEKGEQVLRAKS